MSIKINPVLVEWIDSNQTIGWREVDGLDKDNLNCITIGHLVTKTKDRLVICMNLAGNSKGMHMEIPLVAIKKIRKLKV